MTYEQLERFRRRLLGLRIMLLRRRCQALADERGLMAERELDWTDVAANQTAATVLESLGEAERKAIDRINASLEMVERGDYGECSVCREPIDEGRLRALPDTDRCVRCALREKPAANSERIRK
jgi:RNA polymerase-binding transcription factor DksA